MQSTRPDVSGPATLRDFFLGPPSDWQARFMKTAEGQQGSAEMGRSTGLGAVDRQALISTVADKVKDALNVDINDILVSAWSNHKSLADDLMASKQARDETVLVPLADHTVRSTHQPAVELVMNDRRVAAFKFNVSLMLRIQRAVLKLQAGRIVGAESGAWQGFGQLKCGPVMLVEHETQAFRLPAMFDRTQEASPPPPERKKPISKPAASERSASGRAPHWKRP